MPGRETPGEERDAVICPVVERESRQVPPRADEGSVKRGYHADEEEGKMTRPPNTRSPGLTDITVEKGRFRISTVDVMAERDGLLALSADCDSKYPWVAESATPDGIPEVVIFPDRHRAQDLDETTELETRIILPAYTRGWRMSAAGMRYTVTIVAWREDDRREIWSHDEAEAEADGADHPGGAALRDAEGMAGADLQPGR